jgi:hypothetical protein
MLRSGIKLPNIKKKKKKERKANEGSRDVASNERKKERKSVSRDIYYYIAPHPLKIATHFLLLNYDMQFWHYPNGGGHVGSHEKRDEQHSSTAWKRNWANKKKHSSALLFINFF